MSPGLDLVGSRRDDMESWQLLAARLPEEKTSLKDQTRSTSLAQNMQYAASATPENANVCLSACSEVCESVHP